MKWLRRVISASSTPVATTADMPLMVLNQAEANGPSCGARPVVASSSKGITAGTTPERAFGNSLLREGTSTPMLLAPALSRILDVSDSGLVVAVDSDGHIYEYDLTGVLLFNSVPRIPANSARAL